MASLRTERLNSLAALCRHAGPWDALWERTRGIPPTARAALIAQWVDHFGYAGRFHAIVLWDRQRLVAALPLVARRRFQWLSVLDIPGNEWSPAGQLMLDPQYEPDSLAAALLPALDASRPLWLASVELADPGWQAMATAARQRGWFAQGRRHTDVARIRTTGRWDDHRRRCSRNFRRQLRRAEQRARDAGTIRFRRLTALPAEGLRQALQRGLRLEHRSWKGRQRTSVLATPGMPEFYLRQASELARAGCLDLAFLELNGTPIAFEYGWQGTDTYHSLKIGYDPRWAALSPGQLLTARTLRRCFASPPCRWFDFMGPTSQAITRWRPERRAVGRLLIAPPGWRNRAVVWGTRLVVGQSPAAPLCAAEAAC